MATSAYTAVPLGPFRISATSGDAKSSRARHPCQTISAQTAVMTRWRQYAAYLSPALFVEGSCTTLPVGCDVPARHEGAFRGFENPLRYPAANAMPTAMSGWRLIRLASSSRRAVTCSVASVTAAAARSATSVTAGPTLSVESYSASPLRFLILGLRTPRASPW